MRQILIECNHGTHFVVIPLLHIRKITLILAVARAQYNELNVARKYFRQRFAYYIQALVRRQARYHGYNRHVFIYRQPQQLLQARFIESFTALIIRIVMREKCGICFGIIRDGVYSVEYSAKFVRIMNQYAVQCVSIVRIQYFFCIRRAYGTDRVRIIYRTAH